MLVLEAPFHIVLALRCPVVVAESQVALRLTSLACDLVESLGEAADRRAAEAAELVRSLEADRERQARELESLVKDFIAECANRNIGATTLTWREVARTNWRGKHGGWDREYKDGWRIREFSGDRDFVHHGAITVYTDGLVEGTNSPLEFRDCAIAYLMNPPK